MKTYFSPILPDTPASSSSVAAAEPIPEASGISKVQQGPVKIPEKFVELERDDFHVADMEIDNPYMSKKEKREKKKKFIRMAAGSTWEDPSLGEWEHGEWLTIEQLSARCAFLNSYFFTKFYV